MSEQESDPIWQAAIDSLPDADHDSYGYAEIVNILQDTPLTFRPALLAEMIRIAAPALRIPEQERKPRTIERTPLVRVGFRRNKPARLPDGSRVEVGGGVLRWTPAAPEVAEALRALIAWRAAVLAESDDVRHIAHERLLQAAGRLS